MRGRFTSGKSHTLVMLLAGLLVSVFAGILTFSTTVLADAAWDANGNVTVDGTTHASVMNKQVIKNMGFADGTLVFASSYNSDSSAGQQTISVVSFAPGSDLQSASSATLSQFTFTPPNDWRRTAYEQTAIDGATYPQTTGGQGCNIDQIGWMICGPSMWIAKGVDTIYGWIEDFLTVRELEVSNTSSSLYQAWDIMRGIANVAFIIAFLIIIYSQVSSLGISNYGIKKLAPRLIIAALFVNLSFYICAIAVDLSNILGYTLKDLLDGVNSSLIDTASADNEGVGSTESLVQAFLTGGTLLVGGGLAVSGSLTAGTPLLIPLLLTVFVALLVALVVFAVRQALIVILVVIAPLAFVCYLLPGTEKWFEKWRSTFFTMLFFFPAFAVVFGGAQLAGMLITSNASTIVMVIIGWAVQLAPLALAPLVMKLGGGVLNRVAGIVNDPTKGIIDKSKQWAQNKSKAMSMDSYDKMMQRRQRWKDNGEKGGFAGRAWYGVHGSARRAARYMNNKGRLVKDQADAAEKRAENAYHDSDMYAKMDLISRNTSREAEQITNQLEADYGIARADQLTPKMEKMQTRFFGLMPNKQMEHMFSNMRSLENDVAREGMRKASAQRVLEKRLADNFSADTAAGAALRQAAGRPEDIFFGGERGSQRISAQALTTVNTADEEAIKNATVILEHGNYTDTQIGKIANGSSDHGTKLPITTDLQKAAIRKIYGGSNAVDFVGSLKEIDIPNLSEELRMELGNTLLTNPNKPAWVGAANAAQVKDGKVTLKGQDLLNNWMEMAIKANKFGSAEKIVTQDATYMGELASALPHLMASLPQQNMDEIVKHIFTAKSDTQYRGRIGERKDHVEKIYNLLRPVVSDKSLPATYKAIDEGLKSKKKTR